MKIGGDGVTVTRTWEWVKDNPWHPLTEIGRIHTKAAFMGNHALLFFTAQAEMMAIRYMEDEKVSFDEACYAVLAIAQKQFRQQIHKKVVTRAREMVAPSLEAKDLYSRKNCCVNLSRNTSTVLVLGRIES